MAISPDSYVLFGQVAVAGAAIGTPIVGVVVWLHKRFDKKADKHAVNNQVQELKNEQGVQRAHIGKLFDKLEEHSRRDEELAREVLKRMDNHHAEVLRELGKKADR